MAIKAVRFITGEFCIANVTDVKHGNDMFGGFKFLFENPLLFDVIASDQSPSGLMVGFRTLVPLSKPGIAIEIDAKDIMFWFPEINDEITRSYEANLSRLVAITEGGIVK